ncbi:GAF domain-containing protein [Desulforhopalus vacuolatus]|uniref:GAF domain-containing protein n=1 Tax=Desulforhopalus vacuolatus TaxID=40414 RepID=UPI0019628609|nr:GAF domain-containing protein [Desulforhopalus vacuolatus]MBM9520805.1 GAF domain-containing protein [Desulforhopalus vacuolatus]
MNGNDQSIQINISEEILGKWQNIVDILSELIHIPAALIMRLVQSDIEVFVSSKSENNPYQPGDHEHFLGSGLYCETVIKNNNKLLVPNALADDKWKNNPDIKLNMISYLGFPILLPDGKPFGTICVLDNKENRYSRTYENLLKNFRDIIQSELGLIYMNRILGEENKSLSDYFSEIKTLRGIIPICVRCKKIRDDKGFWTQVEKYIEDHSNVQFSHGLCEECEEELYGDQPWYQKSKNNPE